jgi:hypothetical protein
MLEFAMSSCKGARRSVELAWAAVVVAYYAPLLIFRVIEPDDLLDSELVYNVAAGHLWRGDSSVAHAFLNGHVPLLALDRLTQPLTILYALMPPFPAYLVNDFIVRAVAAAGTFLLMREIEVPRLFRHLLAAMFALGLQNSTYGLTIAGIPLTFWLLQQPFSARRGAALLLVGWNSAIYFSGIFLLATAPLFQAFIMGRQVDRSFWRGLGIYVAGLLLGSAGLLLLLFQPHPIWHRAEWGVFPPSRPFPWRSTGRPLLPLFLMAALLGWRSHRVRYVAGFGLFVIAWYQLSMLPWAQVYRPAGVQVDRFYFLWPAALVLIVALASRATSELGREILAVGTIAGCLAAVTVQQHVRQLGRAITGRGAGYPPIERYYHFSWYRSANLDGPVLSVGTEPMAAPINGVPSIDGYFQLYPLAYKHAFQRVYNDPLIASWGSKLYAKPDADFCAAKALGARYVVSPLDLRNAALAQVRGGELRAYEIRCP